MIKPHKSQFCTTDPLSLRIRRAKVIDVELLYSYVGMIYSAQKWDDRANCQEILHTEKCQWYRMVESDHRCSDGNWNIDEIATIQ